MYIINIFNRSEYFISFLFLLFNFIGFLLYSKYMSDISLQTLIISFIISFSCYLSFIFLESEFDSNILKVFQMKLEKKITFIIFINISITSVSLIIFLNLINYYDYIRDCPFIMDNNNYNLHLKRRCELYNIKKNDTFPYQYICTYNEEKYIPILFFESFEKRPKCSTLKNRINNNEVIDEFIKKYYTKENLYYCDLKHKPSLSLNINPKLCDTKGVCAEFILLIFGIYSYLS